jgi:methionyl-tRNA formyltransferase
MKILVIMNDNSYSGREYLSQLFNFVKYIDVLIIGDYPQKNQIEDLRCGDNWIPLDQSVIKKKFSFVEFDSLKSPDLLKYLSKNIYDLAIQAGTGIINVSLIQKFPKGILNFHPGDLPKYRGCSAPEWQLLDNKPIISTCHFIDKGIDSGPILKKKKLNVDYTSYNLFRSSIYPETAKFVKEIINEIIINPSLLKSSKNQNDASANYYNQISLKEKNKIEMLFKNKKYD